MAFLDEENPSWNPGQVLIITESVGETSCPVFAVHHNHTYFRPASWNLFVLKEANAAARALKVRECICEGPRKTFLWHPSCLDVSVPAYEQDNPESEYFEKFPLGYQVSVDELTVKGGALTSTFPQFYYQHLPDLIQKYCSRIDKKHGFPAELWPIYARTSWYDQSEYYLQDLFYDCYTGDFIKHADANECGPDVEQCQMTARIDARFSPCEEEFVNTPLEDNFGVFQIALSLYPCKGELVSPVPFQSTTGLYYAWRRTEPRVNLAEPFIVSKFADYSENFINTDDYAHYTNEQSPIDWPETLTLTPIH